MNKNYYEILKVPKTASEDEIKKAYRNLAKTYHPDSNPNNKNAEEKLKEINEAYDVIGNPQKRKEYDIQINKSFTTTNQSSKTDNSFTTTDFTNFIFKDDIEEYNKKREKYIKIIDEIEPKFNEYGLTLKNEKAKILNTPWNLNIQYNYFDNKEKSLYEKLRKIKSMAKAFDEFSEFYANVEQEMKNLYNKKFVCYDKYLDPKNKFAFEPKVYNDNIIKIRITLSDLRKERTTKLEQCKEEIKKRNLNFELYLAKRNTDESTIPLASIKTILDSMELIDQINLTLSQFGTTIEDFLKIKGKSLIDMKYKDLIAIKDTINDYISNIKETNSFDINTINLEENDDIIKSSIK